MTKLKSSLLSLGLFASTLSVAHTATLQSLQKELDAVKNKLIELELNNIGSSITFDGDFRTYMGHHRVEISTPTKAKANDTVTLSEFNLNFRANPVPNMFFFGSFRAGYLWNDNFMAPKAALSSRLYQISGSYLNLDRAYFEYKFDNLTSFSLGRLPTTYGPPTRFYTGFSRAGTYPSILYSLPFDGAALTYITNESKDDGRFIFRAIYTPFMNGDYTAFTTPVTAGTGNQFKNVFTKPTHNLMINSEYQLNNTDWFEELNIITQYVSIKFGRPESIDNVRGVLQSGFDSALPGRIDRNVYEIGSENEIVAEAKVFNLYFDIEDIFKLPLSVYFNYKFSNFNAVGNFIARVVEDNNGIGQGPGTINNLGSFIYADDQMGSSVLAGFNFHPFERWFVGAEYLKNNFGSVPGTLRSFNYQGFYSTIGRTYHVYSSYKLSILHARLGFGAAWSKNEADFNTLSFGSTPWRNNTVYSHLLFKF